MLHLKNECNFFSFSRYFRYLLTAVHTKRNASTETELSPAEETTGYPGHFTKGLIKPCLNTLATIWTYHCLGKDGELGYIYYLTPWFCYMQTMNQYALGSINFPNQLQNILGRCIGPQRFQMVKNFSEISIPFLQV